MNHEDNQLNIVSYTTSTLTTIQLVEGFGVLLNNNN